MPHPLLGTVIGQRYHRAAIHHQLFGALGNGGEGIAGNQHRPAEIVCRGINIAACQLVFIGEGDAMDDKIQLAPAFLDFGKHRINGGSIGHITMAHHLGTQFGRQRTHAFFQRVALIGKGQFGPGIMGSFGNSPSNRSVIGNAKNKATLAGQKSRCRCVRCAHDQLFSVQTIVKLTVQS